MKQSTSATRDVKRIGLAMVALASLFVSNPAPAGAGEPGASTCTSTGGELTVELMAEDSSGILSRNAAGVIFYDDEANPPTPPSPCGATVSTTLIRVRDTSDDASTGIVLDLREGHFANGGNPIPIRINLGRGPLDTFGVVGKDTGDAWTFGFDKGNLQDDDHAELRFVSPPDFGFASSRGGLDRVCSGGKRGTGGPSQIGWVFQGGGGADRICGGRDTDRLIGDGGDDTLTGNGGGDTLKGGLGDDRLKGGSSSDLLFGNKGIDGLNGGPGFDGCRGGPGGDIKAQCET